MDSSIYEAMVRMAQDFSLNIPLVDGHGNFGNVDGDSAAAMRYCVTGDTLINTNKGIQKIKDIIKNTKLNSDNNLNIEIKSLNSKNNKAIKLFNSGTHDIYKIKLKNGQTIKGTSNHPILTINNKNQFEWKLIQNLNKSDLCVIDLDTSNQLFGNNELLLEAQFLTIMISKAYINNDKTIILKSSDKYLKNIIKDFFEQKYDFKIKIIFNEDKEIFVLKLTTEVFNKLIKDYNFENFKTNFNNNFLLGNKEYQIEYIKNLFYLYGTVICTKYLKKSKIELKFKINNLEFLSKLQVVLGTQFGIYTNLIENKKTKNNELVIPMDYVFKFKEIIGILDKNKELIINTIPNKTLKNHKYKFLKISSISKVPEEVVYSLKVDSDCHSFTGNGFINHNTEVRLSKISEEMLKGLSDKIVPFQPNFDDEEEEPILLPTKFPNLLLNGSFGIAVGFTSSVPTHNLKELNDCIISYIKKEPTTEETLNGKKNNSTNEQLLKILNGPDFPTGGYIVNKKDLLEIYSTGEGNILIRGKCKEELLENGKTALIITEIPYTYSGRKTKLIENISNLVINKKIDEINEIRDESTNDIRIILELKKGVDIEKVKNKLYKLSPLQDTFTIKLYGLYNKKIKNFSLLDYCKYFSDFQKEIYTKEFQILKDKKIKRIEILQGLKKANEYIDVIIDVIRHSENIKCAESCLTSGITTGIKFAVKKHEIIAKKFNFTELQTENILSTTLRKLNNLEINMIDKELNESLLQLDKYDFILKNEKELYKEIVKNLNRISKEYNIERKTKIIDAEIIEYKEEKIIQDLYLTYDKYGYIKIFDENTYSKLDQEILDKLKFNIKTNSEDNLWFFSSNGKLYQVKLNSLSFSKIKDRGSLLNNIISNKNEKIDDNILFQINQNDCEKLLFVTKKGFIKIVDKNEFISNRNITISSKIQKDDEILYINNLKKEDLNKDIFLSTDTHYLRFNLKEISEQKKNAIGITSIKTDTNINHVEIINTNTINTGNNVFDISKLKKQKRGTKGTLLK